MTTLQIHNKILNQRSNSFNLPQNPTLCRYRSKYLIINFNNQQRTMICLKIISNLYETITIEANTPSSKILARFTKEERILFSAEVVICKATQSRSSFGVPDRFKKKINK